MKPRSLALMFAAVFIVIGVRLVVSNLVALRTSAQYLSYLLVFGPG
jgi:hypothetical protein